MRGRAGRNFWWVAPIYAQAKIAFRRAKRGLPSWAYESNETELTITLINGATIWFKTAEKPDSLYGEDVHAAVIDEASRCREDSWTAVRSTLTFTRGPVRMIGNVKGRKNWFYRMARKAEAGAKGFSYHKITAPDAVAAGVLAAAEIEDAQANLPEDVFRELYLAEASDDGGNPFGLSHIAKCIIKERSGLRPVACGVDLAKSVDWTVVIGLDKKGHECGFERWQSAWELTHPRILNLIGNTPTLIDATGVGDPVVERLQRVRSTVSAFKFTAQTKQQLMEGLVVAIQKGEVGYIDGPIRSELDLFEYVYTRTGVRYSAPEGYHDDCVVALALAVAERQRIMPAIFSAAPHAALRVSPWTGVEPNS